MLLKSEYKIDKIHISGTIGTEDAFATAIIIGVVNAMISIITIKKVETEKIQNYFYSISPQFVNSNIIDIKANIIINIRIKEILSNLIRIKKLVST